MLNLSKPTPSELAKTYASFLPKERINYTALPENKETKREKFEKKYGMLYTGASVVAGAGIFYALYKGGNLFKFTNFAKKHLTHYSAKTMEAMKKFGEYPILQKIRLKTGLFMSNVAQKVFEISNIIGNINPFKDIAFNKFLKAIKINPIFDKLTKVFTNSARKLSFSKYQKASKDLNIFQQHLQEAIAEISGMQTVTLKNGSISGKELAAKLAEKSTAMKYEMNGISKSTFIRRFKNTVNMLNKNSEKEFLDSFKEYKGKSLFQKLVSKVKECGDFIPAKVMESRKNELFAPLLSSKQKLSNNILDLYQNTSKSLDDIFYNNTLTNDALRNSYVKLKDLLSKFKDPSSYAVKRATIQNDIIQELNSAIRKFETIPNNTEKIQMLKNLINTIQFNKKGLIEEAVSACKVLKDTNPDLYNKLILSRNKFQNSLNNAVLFETEKTYRKLLDFSLHSLPTDFLTMGVGVGSVAYITASQKKSRQEKISLNLKNGIPVLGGIIVSFLSNMRQVTSGTGAIFLGLISGIILNRLGSTTNKFYLKHLKNNEIANQNNRPKDLDKVKS